MGIELLEHERIDELQRNGYRIIQNEKKFCFGMDAVLLSGFALVEKGERALDLGTGTGIIPLLLEAKTLGEHFSGLEIQEEMAGMARRSVALNGLEEKIAIVTGDLKEASALFVRQTPHAQARRDEQKYRHPLVHAEIIGVIQSKHSPAITEAQQRQKSK